MSSRTFDSLSICLASCSRTVSSLSFSYSMFTIRSFSCLSLHNRKYIFTHYKLISDYQNTHASNMRNVGLRKGKYLSGYMLKTEWAKEVIPYYKQWYLFQACFLRTCQLQRCNKSNCRL